MGGRGPRAPTIDPNGSLYLEYGRKTGYESDETTSTRTRARPSTATSTSIAGPVSASIERSDYDNFRVIERADGKQPLNRPPALVREHIYTLLGRKPHA